ncbi:ORF6N domain-containing protein [Sporosarcina sp. FSL W7-1283]|uniref:ORF6N domain-containing protein n=1 Tax=Sporosarcina sp. FSL W7-1283 TaxID=2921560 RepID=UPI0030F6AB27
MQQPQIIEHEKQRVLTTSQLADSFATNSKVIARNFQRNQEQYAVGTHYFVLAGEDLKAFKASRQGDASLKYTSVLYLWTEQGAFLHAKSLNKQEAWQAYHLLNDQYYQLSRRIGKGDVSMTSALPPVVAQAIAQAIALLEGRLIELETHMKQVTLHSGEQRRLRLAVGERIYQLSKQDAGARPVMFRSIYSEIRERYQVDSYRDIKQSQLQDALHFVSEWGVN